MDPSWISYNIDSSAFALSPEFQEPESSRNILIEMIEGSLEAFTDSTDASSIYLRDALDRRFVMNSYDQNLTEELPGYRWDELATLDEIIARILPRTSSSDAQHVFSRFKEIYQRLDNTGMYDPNDPEMYFDLLISMLSVEMDRIIESGELEMEIPIQSGEPLYALINQLAKVTGSADELTIEQFITDTAGRYSPEITEIEIAATLSSLNYATRSIDSPEGIIPATAPREVYIGGVLKSQFTTRELNNLLLLLRVDAARENSEESVQEIFDDIPDLTDTGTYYYADDEVERMTNELMEFYKVSGKTSLNTFPRGLNEFTFTSIPQSQEGFFIPGQIRLHNTPTSFVGAPQMQEGFDDSSKPGFVDDGYRIGVPHDLSPNIENFPIPLAATGMFLLLALLMLKRRFNRRF